MGGEQKTNVEQKFASKLADKMKKRTQNEQDGSTFQKNGEAKEAEQESTKRLEVFQTTEVIATASQHAWQMFISKAESREIAGDAIYTALFDSAPSLQPLFMTARAVQAMKFIDGIHEIVMNMGSSETLQLMIETLGFQHLHLDVTAERVNIFRDAIIDLLAMEVGEVLTPDARQGLSSILTYVGGSLIFIRTNYAKRLKLLTDSWKQANDKRDLDTKSKAGSDHDDDDAETHVNDVQSVTKLEADHKKGGLFSRFWGSGQKGVHGASHGDEAVDTSQKHANHDTKSQKGDSTTLPTSFNDMFKINSAVMGMIGNEWMDIVLDSFDSLVVHVQNSERIKEECDVLALRLAKYEQEFGTGSIKLPEFKACMLAALRSSLPKYWTSAHEVAWTWLWENVSRMLAKSSGHLMHYQSRLDMFIESKSEEEFYDIRANIYASVFSASPVVQEYFKQSNTRLHFIARRVIEMCSELFADPIQMVQLVSGLGLRHVEFGIPTDYFGAFVTSCVEVILTVTDDPSAVNAFRWSLGLIAKILVRTINEGSTVVMKAINKNSLKHLKKAIESASRSDRAACLLDIQVGLQSISPLSWAIESGSLDLAKAIIKDLLVIRADRSNYYYGASELFQRHPDIVQRLVEDAPMLLPTLLDGLVWRSRRPENGMRRVNYYVQHLFINQNGQFADGLKWLAATGDPSIITHPVAVLISDTLWNGVVFRQFVVYKVWGILCLIVFIFCQGVLPNSISSDTDDDEANKLYIVIFVGRVLTYSLNLGTKLFTHLAVIWMWCRSTFRTIFEEIDQDGSGSIDWEEFQEAIAIFRQRVNEELKKKFAFLRDDDGPATMEDDRKAIASKSKNTYTNISIALMVLLGIMLTQEPMVHCMNHPSWPTDRCPDADSGLMYRYSILSMLSLILHWLILVDLAVFSTEISAFLLVCGHVLSEVKQFLSALTFLLLLFGSSIPIFCSNCPLVAGNYSSMPRAIVSLFAITLGWFEADPVMDVRDTDQIFLAALFSFVGITVILLLNLLIAQLNRSYEYIYQDMLGFARLNRASLIVDAMLAVGKSKWARFRHSLSFEQKLEFDHGDLGLSGGIQLLEAQNLHMVTDEAIRRFGGSTEGSMPWPEEKNDVDDQDERFDRIENLFKRGLKTMTKRLKQQNVVHGSKTGSGSGGNGSGSLQDASETGSSTSGVD